MLKKLQFCQHFKKNTPIHYHLMKKQEILKISKKINLVTYAELHTTTPRWKLGVTPTTTTTTT